jgi:hypothetical protein
MTGILSAPRAYLRDLRSAFVHAPLEVLLGVTLSVTFSIALREANDAGREWWAHVLVFVVIALAPLFGLSMLQALGRIRPGMRWMLSAVLLAAVAAYAWGVFDPDHGAEAWRTAMLAGAGVFLFALVPRVGARGDVAGDRLRTWRFWWATGTRVVVVGLYAAALYVALAGAIGAVASLFDLKTNGRLYGDLAGAIFFALVPCVVVGGTPEIARSTDDGVAPVPRWVRLLGRWLYLPVVVIYGAILYAYTVRVLLSGELPKNLLSPLVLFAGLFALLGAIVLEPLHGDDDAPLTRRVMRFVPVLLLPLLPLAFRAVLLRHGQHGWTEFRYLRLAVLAALAALAIAGAVRLARRRPPLLTTVPAVLAAVLLISAIGPWSAPAVSRRDQLGRLRAALAGAGLLRGGRLDLPAYRPKAPHAGATRLVPAATYDRVRDIVDYLGREHGTASLAGVIAHAGTYPGGWALAESLPLRRGCSEQEERARSAELAGGVPGIQGGTWYPLRRATAAEMDTTRSPTAVLARTESTTLRLKLPGPGGWETRLELGGLVARLSTPGAECDAPDGNTFGQGAGLTAVDALRPLADAAGRPLGQLVLTSVAVRDSVRGGRRFAAGLERVEGWVVVGR